MSTILPFSRETDVIPGILQEVAPGLRRILANNPSSLTYQGTNSYIVGTGEVALVDPGPDDDEHQNALLAALQENNEQISHIFLTHNHKDHSNGIRNLADQTGAEILGHDGDVPSRHEIRKNPKSETFIDLDYAPDKALQGGETISHGDWELEVVHTPGHAPDHLCYALNDGETMLSGDHVMGWNTSVVAPPEGHMGDYISSLEALLERPETIYFPGHGGRVNQAKRLVKALIMHRRWRESQILDCLRNGADTIDSIVPRIYEGLASELLGAASYSVYAHLIFLIESGRIVAEIPNDIRSRFEISNSHV